VPLLPSPHKTPRMDSNSNSSSSHSMDDTILNRSPAVLRIFIGCIIILISVLGILGNSLTIAALIKSPKLRNLTVAFIISLCIADLLFCVMVMPFTAHRLVTGIDFAAKHQLLCVLHPLIQYANVGVSLLSIAMITVNRFVMIAHHSLYARIYTKKTVAAMVSFTWIFSFALLIPTLCGKWGKFGFDNELKSCSITRNSTGSSSAKMSLFLIGFIIPCLAIVICYAGIFWVVRKSDSRMRNHVSVGSQPTTSSNSSEKRKVTKSGSDWRLTKMILAIFLSFIFCYLPTTIIKVVDRRVSYPDAHTVSYAIIYFSACINPIIYVTMNRQYRQAYKSLLFCAKLSEYRTTSPSADANTERNMSVKGPILRSASNQAMIHVELQTRFSEETSVAQ